MESPVKIEADDSSSVSTTPDESSVVVGPSKQEMCEYHKSGTCNRSNCSYIHLSSEKADQQTAEPKQVSGNTTPGTSSFTIDPLKWINAPIFVPRSKQSQPVVAELSDNRMMDKVENVNPEKTVTETKEENDPSVESSEAVLSYAEIVTLNSNHNGSGIVDQRAPDCPLLCPYYEVSGVCMVEVCPYEHGELCEFCGKFCLNPADMEQQRLHNAECIKQHERDMEHSFAIQRSKDKVCGICLEVIMEKPGRLPRFGILPNCNHIFCLECIRTWRQAKNFENKIKRGCPTCRISSDFVCPSIIWVEDVHDKEKLIDDYKKACNTTHCKHFKQGSGKCPFGNKCFYKHALPSGELVDVGGPSRPRGEGRPRITHLQDFFREVLHQRGRMLDDFVSMFFSESDDSEHSENYDYYDI
ncbi:probable E3 ubiquitin-protein ligase makorin-1 [Toxorhynchites rutilus septentrionalis]|uniref:probable E3 ubiquitin-protein ligase makorin-1 n=1 Tax=Toxorhynchites rutilus septentrionalis TaxID=329112 RepID=UPI00247A0FED|nr:probable E3 ubiquitin-protein ligase makorin-1 [Toxorhynchites rutilus septentrionalis]